MSTIQAKYLPQGEVASNTATSVPKFYEPQTASPHSIPVSELQHNLDRWAERNQSLVITTAGKSGVGTSTMINNFLDLNHDKMSPILEMMWVQQQLKSRSIQTIGATLK